jgi:hypothetical protein
MTISEDLGNLSKLDSKSSSWCRPGTAQQIARKLVISQTASKSTRNIFESSVSSRTEATMEAVRRGWVAVLAKCCRLP